MKYASSPLIRDNSTFLTQQVKLLDNNILLKEYLFLFSDSTSMHPIQTVGLTGVAGNLTLLWLCFLVITEQSQEKGFIFIMVLKGGDRLSSCLLHK